MLCLRRSQRVVLLDLQINKLLTKKSAHFRMVNVKTAISSGNPQCQTKKGNQTRPDLSTGGSDILGNHQFFEVFS